MANTSVLPREEKLQSDVEMAHSMLEKRSPSLELADLNETDGHPLLTHGTDVFVKIDMSDVNTEDKPICRLTSLTIALLIAFCAIVAVAPVLFVTVMKRANTPAHGSHWHGFSGVNHLFAFGDSWTDSHFMPFDDQPSTVNPMGNPSFPGGTSSHARNYVGYLATEYNESFIAAYDLALSGAVVNSTIIPTFVDWLDLVHEAKDRFMPFYTPNDTSGISDFVPTGWTSESSLFTIFFGINDIAAADKEKAPFAAIFDSYKYVIDTLYDTGARNFLLMNVPPIDRSPAITSTNRTQYMTDIKAGTADWNNRLKDLAKTLRNQYQDITVFEFDTWSLFTQIMDDPQSLPQTRSYKNVNTTCALWETLPFGAIPTEEQVEECGGLGIEEYLWINSFHITWPAHDAIAAGLKDVLTLDVYEGSTRRVSFH